MVVLARLAAWLFFVAILILTFVPPTLRPLSGLPHNVEHLAIFFLLGAAFALGYRGHAWALGLMGITGAAVLESLQIFTPGRHARLTDFLVDALGICLGIAAATLLGAFGRFSAKKTPVSSRQEVPPR
jgi:VanZ family protein